MNTFGFVGALEGTPSIDCIYQNDAAKNLFLERGGDTPPRNRALLVNLSFALARRLK